MWVQILVWPFISHVILDNSYFPDLSVLICNNDNYYLHLPHLPVTTHYKARAKGAAQDEADKWKKTEAPGTDLGTAESVLCARHGTTDQWTKDALFSKWCWGNWLPSGQK